ncbi:MAG: T9SS type A sorting domain-containing protein [Ginsengibacter sp.]
MKKFITLLFVFTIASLTIFSQTSGNYISSTITQGSQTNSIYITIQTNTDLVGAKFSTFEFSIGVLVSASPTPTATITALNPNISYTQTNSIESQSSSSFNVFTFLGDGSQAAGAAMTYTTGTPYQVAEVFFTGGPITPSNVRVMQLPNGGGSGNVFFFVTDRGFDVTNQPVQFYSSIPANVSNDGAGYTGSSYVTTTVTALPIKLTNFSASKKDKDAILNWQIANQDANSSYFNIERGFTGTDFKSIGRVDVNLNSGATATYAFNDVNIAAAKSNGIIYYRLKLVDKDSKFSYSQIRNVKLSNKGFGVNLYPNPAKGFSNVSIELSTAANITLSITDAAGRIVQNMEFAGYKGLNQKKIDLSKLAGGSYMLKVNTGTEVQTVPLIKE